MKSAPGATEVSRRKFLSWAIGGISAVVSAVVAAPVIGYFLSPAWKKSALLPTPIAPVSEIPIGVPTFVTYEERIRDAWVVTTLSKGAWVVTKDGKEFSVFDPRCTHLNCPYYWDKQKGIFQCPCHDGRFDIDGNVTGGPPPRSLDRLEFIVQEGVIQLTGRILKG